jgi:hypothetical protein
VSCWTLPVEFRAEHAALKRRPEKRIMPVAQFINMFLYALGRRRVLGHMVQPQSFDSVDYSGDVLRGRTDHD